MCFQLATVIFLNEKHLNLGTICSDTRKTHSTQKADCSKDTLLRYFKFWWYSFFVFVLQCSFNGLDRLLLCCPSAIVTYVLFLSQYHA